MSTDFLNIWHTVYSEFLCNVAVIDEPTAPTQCFYTTLGNINCRIEQGSAPAHRTRHTIMILQRETPKFIPPDLWPPNSHGVVPLSVEYGA